MRRTRVFSPIVTTPTVLTSTRADEAASVASVSPTARRDASATPRRPILGVPLSRATGHDAAAGVVCHAAPAISAIVAAAASAGARNRQPTERAAGAAR